ncbi:hypothetical protein [Methanothermococcus okinawensis]|uniref:Uncharacterized protein n=1 Tax=Methanothermococcus okinawensis (strain DSM 14208 / JCM 11175 / IH1) TaxID=647113 RepID=F8AN42_METOI|nr:hypothetical protein [Methanothermococcus okinawensis]AEH06956.1 hypothetical protein Metok_0986 [Methanothermococcus okinawensis IH1]
MKKYIALISLLCIIGAISAVSAYGTNGPLKVTYEEKYNITGNATANGITSNIHNITAYIIINNTATDVNDTLNDVWVAVNMQNNNITGLEYYNKSGIVLGNNVADSPDPKTNLSGGNKYIHICTLGNNSWIIYKFSYNVSNVPNVGAPIIVNESYSTTKVSANEIVNWTVHMTLQRNTTSDVSVKITKYLSNDYNNYGNSTWTLLNISKNESSTGSTVVWNGPYTSNNNDALNWTDILLSDNSIQQLNFTVTANSSYSNRNASEIPYGFAVIYFNYSNTHYNATDVIPGIFASGYGQISADKQGPEQDANGNYVVWYENATFKNKAKSYSFNLTNVNIWAVNGSNPTTLDPFNTTYLINGSNHTYGSPLPTSLAPGAHWNTSKYNFTFSNVPVVWANCTFKVADNNITILNRSVNEYSTKYGSTYIITEYMQIVGGYLIKVTKHIIPNKDGTYDIYIVVENIGSAKSPYIYAYDLIPQNFSIIGNISVNESYMLNNTGNHSVSNPKYNMSIYWALNPLNGGADGDGSYNDSTGMQNNETVVIHYKLNGTGTFYPSDAFIVGIDPTHSLLPTTSPKITLVSGAIAENYEPLLMLLSGLVGIGCIIRRRKNN